MAKEKSKRIDLEDLADNYQAPSIDEYVDLKWREIQRERQARVEERKRYLQKLKLSVQRQRAKSAGPARSRSKRDSHDLRAGTLIRGRTYNIEFKTINIPPAEQ